MRSSLRTLRCRPAAFAVAAAVMASVAAGGVMPRIQVAGTEFRAETGEAVWLNGINTAWVHWNDFGGGRFDWRLWEAEFRRYADAGINCARVWIDCDGEVAVAFDAAGRVAGPAGTLFDDVEALLDIARRHGVHVLAVLVSFDHVKPSHPKHRLWRQVFNEDDRLERYVRHFVEPLARRFSGDPTLLAWEICNEPEWIWVNRYGVSRERVIAFHARVAAALHGAGAKLVTTGSASWRWHSDRKGWGARSDQPWSDASLAAYSADPGARLDFYQVHYYDWMAVLGWNPFDRGATPARYLRVVDRPVIIGETRGRYSWWTRRTVEQTYELGSANGYAGVFGWSAHGRDGHGNFEEIALATRFMADRIRSVASGNQPGDRVHGSERGGGEGDAIIVAVDATPERDGELVLADDFDRVALASANSEPGEPGEAVEDQDSTADLGEAI